MSQAVFDMTPLLVFNGEDPGVLFDFGVFLSTRLLIQGSSRSGKTHMLRYILEAYAGKVPQLIIDWEGELHTLKEVYEYIWVGDVDAGADIPARAETARRHCRRLMASGASVILDLSDLDEDDRYELVALWLDELMHIPKALRRVILVAIAEVHELAPNQGDVPCSKAVRRLVSRGGKRGLVPLMDTQRLAMVHKSVAEVGNVLIGRTTNDVDVDRAATKLGLRNDQRSSLETLQRGTFFAYGPAIGNGRPILVRSGDTRSHHPDVLRGAVQAPPPPAELAAAMLALRNAEDLDPEDSTRQELIEEIERLKAQLTAAIAGNSSDPADIRRAVDQATRPLLERIEGMELQRERMLVHARLVILDAGEIPPSATLGESDARQPEDPDPTPSVRHLADGPDHRRVTEPKYHDGNRASAGAGVGPDDGGGSPTDPPNARSDSSSVVRGRSGGTWKELPLDQRVALPAAAAIVQYLVAISGDPDDLATKEEIASRTGQPVTSSTFRKHMADVKAAGLVLPVGRYKFRASEAALKAR